MKQKFLLKTMLLLCALVAGSSSVWGVTFTAGTDKGETSVTKEGVTVSMSTMSRDDEYRTYASTNMTITSTVGNITSVIITCTGSGTSSYGPGKFSGTGYSYSGTTGTWTGSATSVTLSASAQVRMTQIVVTLAGSGTSYTITAVSNNTDWGTVALSETTITATPASGYQVSTSTPYEVTVGTAEVAQTGNAFVVTPSSNCTVQINFEAISLYTVTITPPDNGSLTVKVGNTDVISGNQYPAGTVLNITATPNDGYNFKNIQVIDASTHTYSTSNTREYTLTAHNTMIKANFDPKVYHSVNWYVNGTISSTVEVEEGTAITKPTTDPANIGGKKFMGWVDTAIDGVTDTKPTFFTTANMGTSDLNYYAVFATVDSEGPDTYEKITSSTLDTDETYVLGAQQASNNTTMWYFYDYDEVDKNTNWGKSTNTPTVVSPLKLTLSGTVSSFIVRDENGKYLVPWKGNFRMESASTNATISINSNGVLSGTSAGDHSTGVTLRYNHNSGNGGFRWYDGSTGTLAYLYKVISGTSYSGYCTSVTATITLADACTDGSLYYGTYSNGTAFVVPSDLIVSEISVIDGQLVILDYDTDDVVPANTGVLVVSDVAGGHTVTLTTEAGTSVLGDDNMLKPSGDNGVTASDMADTDYYYYRLTMYNEKPGFWWKSDNGAGFALAANKAYLKVPITEAGTVTSQASGFTLGDHETTGVNDVRSNTEDVRCEYFNLAGQRVAQPTKGLYIVNGRKVVIK